MVEDKMKSSELPICAGLQSDPEARTKPIRRLRCRGNEAKKLGKQLQPTPLPLCKVVKGH